MKQEKRREALANICVALLAGAGFLILLFLLKWNFFLVLFLTVGLYVGFSFLLKPRQKIGNINIEDIPDGEELHRRLNEAKEDFDSIARSMNRIQDPEVWQQADRLNRIAEGIIKHLEQHPEKIKLARQFIDYYQDTASNVLSQYVELQESNLQTEEVKRLKEKTKQSLETLNVAFEQQFQKLMRNEMLDMDAEMRLLEQTVKMEK
ncbi:MAG: 5-bromo-4-chloroindolyl phosphate hydrolysis family protein [Lachnospiraceae bacterium]|nr:5-bromo-4-chloroindolyl phosphate hydrolysis family protein [Lachnospiraceae bacterium]